MHEHTGSKAHARRRPEREERDAADWLEELRASLEAVQRVRLQGPA